MGSVAWDPWSAYPHHSAWPGGWPPLSRKSDPLDRGAL